MCWKYHYPFGNINITLIFNLETSLSTSKDLLGNINKDLET